MAAYTVTTVSSGEPSEPFRVVVKDECERRVLELGAMSRDHAGMMAGSLALLLPKLDPGRTVVLDASIRGRGWTDVGKAAA
jgi:hypothetical protein